ncbi:cytochrome d ubiquinol oxidase subunit II [Zunongwangia endophytica]|uniref:Cytochrome d ubiquinol oxidase subunit II n=1 Tax=Zunongwangia endophytica TaxID=1808945 RepID=A0ABV8HEU9_9FLAO|nr:cytochrome d ubiquinol oxidase subunit II [Zunongwangia endophytica]MDN3593756.1 cytochrome d ubiquinol oxidase subunit II [Zunongwangia endophytica]
MLYVVLFFLFFSLLLYVLLGGADFGAGIVELFSSRENKKVNRDTIYRVMGPIWEANHIWLIILIVILWIAFPMYFNILIIHLHVPLTLVLLGITMRGVSFVFRHYDAFEDKSQLIYNALFRFSSFITPVFLGMCFAALVGGKIIITEDYSNYTFYELFMAPWFNAFGILMGLFYASLCAFLASTLLIGESEGDIKNMYIRKSKISTGILVLLGFILIVYGFFNEIAFIWDFVTNPISLVCIVLSGILLFPLWKFIRSGRRILSRYFAGLQVFLVLFAALIAHFPNVIITSNQEVNLLADISPDSVITVLGISLIIGGGVILPGLFHLMKSFKMIKIFDREEQQFQK